MITWNKTGRRHYVTSCGTFSLLRRDINGGRFWQVVRKLDLMYQKDVSLVNAVSADEAKAKFSKLF